MKTINEILDEESKNVGYRDWSHLLDDGNRYDIYNVVKKSSIAYATIAIEEQKKSCLTAYYVSAGWKDADNRVADAINNAPNVELK